MKRLAAGTMALLAGAFIANGQGYVSFGNYNSSIFSYLYVSYKTVGLGGSTTGPTPTLSNYTLEVGNGNDWTVQLYGAVGSDLPSSALSPLTGITANFADGVQDRTAGTWVSAATYGFSGSSSGDTATIQLYAWYNDGGAITSFAQAATNGVPLGLSMTANVTLGTLSSPTPLPPQALGDFTLTLVPEPSTLALGVLGVCTYLMRRRK